MASEREPKRPGVRIVRGFTDEDRRRAYRDWQRALAWPRLFLALLAFLTAVGLPASIRIASSIGAAFGWRDVDARILLSLRLLWVAALIALASLLTSALYRWHKRRATVDRERDPR